MKSYPMPNSFPTRIDIQPTMISLTTEELYTILAGQKVSCRHIDMASGAKIDITLLKNEDKDS